MKSLHGLIVCLCVCAHFCLLIDSTAAEERFTAESSGCLLQGTAGTTGEEGKRVINLLKHFAGLSKSVKYIYKKVI